MTDPGVEFLEAKLKRVFETMVVIVVIAVVYFFAMILVLREFGQFMPGWLGALVMLPFFALGVAAAVLRVRSRWLRTDVAVARVRVSSGRRPRKRG